MDEATLYNLHAAASAGSRAAGNLETSTDNKLIRLMKTLNMTNTEICKVLGWKRNQENIDRIRKVTV